MLTTEHLHFRQRAAGAGSKFQTFFTVDIAPGVRAKYGTTSEGRHALQDVLFAREKFGRPQAKAWLDEHDETTIAVAGRVRGEVFVRLGETWEGLVSEKQDEPLTIDRKANAIRNARLCGMISVNRRDYSEALHPAVALYEGVACNLNHPKPGETVRVEDRFGLWRNARPVESGLRGDLHYNPEHPNAKQLLWFAENMPGAIASSHRVNAVGVARPDGIFAVKRIDRVFAVELVADGGTNRGLYESSSDDSLEEGDDDSRGLAEFDVRSIEEKHGRRVVAVRIDAELIGGRDDAESWARSRVPEFTKHDHAGNAYTFAREGASTVGGEVIAVSPGVSVTLNTKETRMDPKSLTLEILRLRPDLCEALIAESSQTAAAKKAHDDLVAERDRILKENGELKAKVDTHEAAKKLDEQRTAIRKQCKDAGVAEANVTDLFVEACIAVNDDAKRKSLIEERARMTKAPSSRSKSQSQQQGAGGAQGGSGGASLTRSGFVESVTGHAPSTDD